MTIKRSNSSTKSKKDGYAATVQCYSFYLATISQQEELKGILKDTTCIAIGLLYHVSYWGQYFILQRRVKINNRETGWLVLKCTGENVLRLPVLLILWS